MITESSPAFEGDSKAKVLVVAEAPSSVEMIKRRPLVGPTGQLFDTLASNAGLLRHKCQIVNVWPDQVYRDKDVIRRGGEILWTKHGFTDDGMAFAEQAARRIRASEANVIVCLGQIALALCTDISSKIGKWRGSILAGTGPAEGKKVIATYHPAASLHGNFLWRYTIQTDLKRVVEESAFPELRLPQRELILEPGLRQAVDFVHECRERGRFATDLEVINHQVSCLSLCFDPKTAMTVPFTDETGQHYWTEAEELEFWRAYAEAMGDPTVDKVNQNLIGFDMPFLLQQNNIYTRGRLLDTMVAQHILYPEFPKGLDFLCSVYTREPYYKDEGKLWKKIGDAGAGDLQTFWRYCAKDSATALEIWRVLEKDLHEQGFWHTYELTERLAMPLAEMTARGLAVDRNELEHTKTQLEANLADLEQKLVETADYPFSPTSPKQCMEYFYSHKRCHPYVNKDGKPTSDDKAMSRIYRRYNLPEAKLVQDIRALKKLLGTYIEVGLDADGRLRCSWNPRGTWTGRLSSSQTIFGTGLNLQNLHPAFKGFIVSDDLGGKV